MEGQRARQFQRYLIRESKYFPTSKEKIKKDSAMKFVGDFTALVGRQGWVG
jgi:hypothetical protein